MAVSATGFSGKRSVLNGESNHSGTNHDSIPFDTLGCISETPLVYISGLKPGLRLSHIPFPPISPHRTTVTKCYNSGPHAPV